MNRCNHRVRFNRLEAVILVLALTVSACAVGPDFAKPDSILPKQRTWQTGQDAAPTVPSQVVAEPMKAEWWSVFNDPMLTELEKRAVNANLTVLQAAVRLGQSRAQREIAAADQFPMLNGNTSYTRQMPSKQGILAVVSGLGRGGSGTIANGTGNGGIANGTGIGVIGIPSAKIGPFSLWQYGFDASWELDLWGRVRRELESAEASVEASKESEQATLLSVMAEVARDYIELRRIQRLLVILHQTIETQQENLNLTEQKAARGTVTELDVAQAKTQLANFQAQTPTLEQQESQTINQLSLLLGGQPNALRAELTTAVPMPPVPPRVPVGVPAELARRRPDIRQAEAQLHAATAEIGVSVANFYPRVTLSGSVGLQGLKLKDMVDWAALQYAIGPSITVPIFQGGRLMATLELRKAEQQEAAIVHHNTVLQAWHEVDNALTAYAKEQQRNEFLAQAAQSNREELELARLRYQGGVSDYLPVLTAQQSMLRSEQDFANSTGSVATNLVALYKALGGGWMPPPEKLDTASR